jgi:hypothetical protein
VPMFSVYGPSNKRNTSQKGGGLDCAKLSAHLKQNRADLFTSGSKLVISISTTVPRSVFLVILCYSPVPVPVGVCDSASGAKSPPKQDPKRMESCTS